MARLTAKQAATLKQGAQDILVRRMDALSLFRALPTQLPFFNSNASERILRGGNRSGKTTSAAALVASAATGMPVLGPDGEPLPFPWRMDRQEEPFVIWCIGKGMDHIGSPIYSTLFRAGAFKMIRDKETQAWRAWRPWEEDDAKRESETKPAPPLIPPRYLDGQPVWVLKGQHVFKLINLKLPNGGQVKIYAFTSNSDPKQGDKVDLLWIDEDIDYPDAVHEWQMRLADRKGRLVWSALPHSKNYALVDMCERAREEAENNPEHPDVHETVITYSGNPFISEAEKKKTKKRLVNDPDELRKRDLGEFVNDNIAMYPSFSKNLHCTPAVDESLDDTVDRLMRANAGIPPADWTRWLVLDPGHARPAVLLAAVPPPEIGDCIVVYDEVAAPNTDADYLARVIHDKAAGQQFEEFIIDGHAAKQTPMGFGKTIYQQYSGAFRKQGLKSRLTDHGFIFGSDDVDAGINCVRELMLIGTTGKPRLRIVTARCPSLVRQVERYRKDFKERDRYIADKPAPRQVDDHADCLRYLAARNPQFNRKAAGKTLGSPAFQYWKKHYGGDYDTQKEATRLGVPVSSIN